MATFTQVHPVGISQDDATLEDFLKPHMQPWRLPILLQNGGITVQRGGQAQGPLAVGFRVRARDIVITNDVYAQSYVQLRAEATRNFADYLFVASDDNFHKEMRAVYSARGHAYEQDSSNAFLETFIEKLVPLGKHPIRHIVIITHANAQGELFLFRSATAAPLVTWEDLEQAVQDRTWLIQRKEDTVLPRPEDGRGTRIPAAVIIRGCNFGRAPAVLDKMREALGGLIDVVVAPKFVSAAATTLKNPAGHVEYMEDEFLVYSPTDLTRAQLIAAFQAQQLTDWRGQPVDDKAWDPLLPKYNLRDPQSTQTFAVRLPGQSSLRNSIQAHYARTLYTTTHKRIPVTKQPANKDLKALVHDLYKRTPGYSPNHPWPVYRRQGYSSLQQMVDGYAYKLADYSAANGTCAVTVERYVFQIRVPMRQGDTLVSNFYPAGGAPPPPMIDENDDTFFGRSAHIPSHFAKRI